MKRQDRRRVSKASRDAVLVLELAIQDAELRAQLAEAQEQLVEMAVDAGHLHAQVADLQAQLAKALALIPRRRDAPDQRASVDERMSKDEARRMAIGMAALPDLRAEPRDHDKRF